VGQAQGSYEAASAQRAAVGEQPCGAVVAAAARRSDGTSREEAVTRFAKRGCGWANKMKDARKREKGNT
jgi:hypothetical protein